MHGKGIYPGTGYKSYGNIFNFPLDYGVSNKEYEKYLEKAFEIINSFDPDYLLISLGLDFHREDPLSIFNLDFKVLKYLLEKIKNFDFYMVLEGGYNYKILYHAGKIIGGFY